MSTRPTWAANLRGAQPVRLRVRGRWCTAKPTVVEGRDPVADLLGEVARRKGRRRWRRCASDCPATGNPTRHELLGAASTSRLVRFRLTD